ncbi:42588_t:CDS:2, partial [Gigaspora margarita]
DNKLQCDWEQWMQEKTATKSFGAYNKDNDSKNNDDKDNENVCIEDDDEGQTSFCHQYLSRKITASQIDKELVDATNLLATPHNIKGSFSIGRSILYKATTKYMNSGYEVNTELVALAVDDIENRIEPETTTWKKFDR